MNSSERFSEERLPNKKCLLVQQKKEKLLLMVKY